MNAIHHPLYCYNSWSYLPPAWNAPVYGSWGLGNLASSWISSSYQNPYLTPSTQIVYVQQPVTATGGVASPAEQQVAAYDYSEPIDVASAPTGTSGVETAQAVFESARSLFQSGQYGQALNLADEALVQLPNDPVLHEFRSQALFALGRYDEAAAAIYAVLWAGPPWDWTTMIQLYGDAEAYNKQLRALESLVARSPADASKQFLLGYHYLVQGHQDAAAARFTAASKLRSQDALAAKLAKALSTKQPATAVAQTASGATTPTDPSSPAAEEPQGPPPPPPAEMVGTWQAKPQDGMTITMTLDKAGAFTWSVSQEGRTQTIQGEAGYQDKVLVLSQSSGPPLSGKVQLDSAAGALTFLPTGASGDTRGLSFRRQVG